MAANLFSYNFFLQRYCLRCLPVSLGMGACLGVAVRQFEARAHKGFVVSLGLLVFDVSQQVRDSGGVVFFQVSHIGQILVYRPFLRSAFIPGQVHSQDGFVVGNGLFIPLEGRVGQGALVVDVNPVAYIVLDQAFVAGIQHPVGLFNGFQGLSGFVVRRHEAQQGVHLVLQAAAVLPVHLHGQLAVANCRLKIRYMPGEIAQPAIAMGDTRRGVHLLVNGYGLEQLRFSLLVPAQVFERYAVINIGVCQFSPVVQQGAVVNVLLFVIQDGVLPAVSCAIVPVGEGKMASADVFVVVLGHGSAQRQAGVLVKRSIHGLLISFEPSHQRVERQVFPRCRLLGKAPDRKPCETKGQAKRGEAGFHRRQ